MSPKCIGIGRKPKPVPYRIADDKLGLHPVRLTGVADMPTAWQRTTLALALVLAALLSLAAAIIISHTSSGAPAALRTATLLASPRPIAEFELVDQHGTTVTHADLRGRWTILFAGFTHCPDACPATLAVLSQALAQVSEKDAVPRAVLLTVDPARDTAAQLASYLAYFPAPIVGLTGSETDIATFAGNLGLSFIKVPGTGEQYTVDHSTALVLIDPHGRLYGYITPPLDHDDLVADIEALIALR
jgi:protein SCO1